MKAELAESILKAVVEWDVDKFAKELQDIQVIAEYKYNDYQQYTHGMRYVESLALWLRKFSGPEKEVAYSLVKKRLIFISEEQMRQLISVSYAICMKEYLLAQTKQYCMKANILEPSKRKNIFNISKRKSLFLGLSDGSHMDYFRRQNSHLSNEQVFVNYDFSKERASGMVLDLKKDLGTLCEDVNYSINEDDTEFRTFFLIDDFSASGISYIRKENGEWKGKIPKFYKLLEHVGFPTENITIHIVLYVATKEAIEHIKCHAKDFLQHHSCEITVDAIQLVSSVKLTAEEENLLRSNYESNKASAPSFVDSHFQKGRTQKPYLGFNECSLPLIIYHNTPNNSFPILWHAWGKEDHALFPRTTRHKEA